jgi:hypothetical protein
MVLLVWPPAAHLWIGRNRGNLCLTAMSLDGQHRRTTLAEDPGSTRPERHFPSGAAQTRVVSVARIRLHPRKFVRPFKGIICGDISEFESHMPSHAVRSLGASSGLQKPATQPGACPTVQPCWTRIPGHPNLLKSAGEILVWEILVSNGTGRRSPWAAHGGRARASMVGRHRRNRTTKRGVATRFCPQQQPPGRWLRERVASYGGSTARIATGSVATLTSRITLPAYRRCTRWSRLLRGQIRHNVAWLRFSF